MSSRKEIKLRVGSECHLCMFSKCDCKDEIVDRRVNESGIVSDDDWDDDDTGGWGGLGMVHPSLVSMRSSLNDADSGDQESSGLESDEFMFSVCYG